MALLTTYTDANKVWEEAEKTVITQVILQWGDIPRNLNRETTTGRFRYVGMDYATAVACQDAMIEAYAPAFPASDLYTSSADVRACPVGGSMWEVSVSYMTSNVVVDNPEEPA